MNQKNAEHFRSEPKYREIIVNISEPPVSTLAQPANRRHDLDALRAFAMLLGIGLHAALAYIPNIGKGWPVSDINTHQSYGVFMAAIHGFRMPLFFLLSGFFTAMLWRKRGLGRLIQHRAKRILLPLVIGLFTIVLAVWAVSITAGIITKQNVVSLTKEVDKGLWTAIVENDATKLEQAIVADAEIDLNQLASDTGLTPLATAAAHDMRELAEVLLEHDAVIDAPCRDKSTAAHLAFFFWPKQGQCIASRAWN